MEKIKVTGRTSPIFKGESGQTSKDGVSKVIRKYSWPTDMPFLAIDTVHASFPGMVLTDISYELASNKVFYEVSYTYEGDQADTDGSGSSFEPRTTTEIRVSAQEEPISTHPKFSDFATEENGAKFDKDGLFLGFSKGSPYAGITSYFAPGAEYSVTTTSRTGGASLSEVGKINSPSGAPSVPSGYNWLFMGITQTKHGTVTSTSRVWKLSGRGGWNKTIYQ